MILFNSKAVLSWWKLCDAT